MFTTSQAAGTDRRLRARRLSAADRREQLLDAAERTFVRHGWERTKMQDIADEAGVAIGLLYKHESSKDTLYDAVCARQKRRLYTELSRAVDDFGPVSDPREVLAAGCAVWVGFVASGEMLEPRPGSGHEGIDEDFRQLIADVIGRVAPTSPLHSRVLIAGLLEGAATGAGYTWQRHGRQWPADEVLHVLMRVVWDGLADLRSNLPA